MSTKVTRLLVAAFTIALVIPTLAMSKTSVSPGCNTSECARRVCKSASCKARTAPKPKPASATTPAVASWYGPGLYGNPLGCAGQNGIPANARLTPGTWGVAHKTLPCGTRVRICQQSCAVAPVLDRGPYVGGRDFDLTAPVRNAVGGTGAVRYRVVG